jgi:hypothetical protein
VATKRRIAGAAGGLLALVALLGLAGSLAATARGPTSIPTEIPESHFFPYIRQGKLIPTPAFPTPELIISDLSYVTPDEYVQVTNKGSTAQFMEGWQIHSVIGDEWYTFPAMVILAPGASVRVHSGAGATHSPPTDLLWDTAYIWLNSGDQAVLYDQHCCPVDDWCYGSGCP